MKRFLWLLVGFLMLGTGFVFSDMPDGCKSGMSCDKEMGHGKEMKCKMGKKCSMKCELRNVKMYLKIKEKLNLTDEQVKTLKKICSDFERDAIKRQADCRLACLDLKEIIHQEKQDFAATREKTKQISELQLASKLAMIDAMENGFNTLTKEQQDKLPQLKKEMKKDWKKKETDEKE